jgi:hypothetical protein
MTIYIRHPMSYILRYKYNECMKRKILECILGGLLFLLSANGYCLEKKDAIFINKLIQDFKSSNVSNIAEEINYPLGRAYPIPPIKNKEEFMARFGEVFDQILIEKIVNSTPDKDWEQMGWRGIMLGDGDLWLDGEKIWAVNYQSAAEKTLQLKLIQDGKLKVHPSLRNYATPVLSAKTKNYLLRIDQLETDTYRYSSWGVKKDQSEEPDMVLNNGQWEADGSGGNHFYLFRNGKYTYKFSVIEIGEGDSPPGELEVYKSGKSVLREPVIDFE